MSDQNQNSSNLPNEEDNESIDKDSQAGKYESEIHKIVENAQSTLRELEELAAKGKEYENNLSQILETARTELASITEKKEAAVKQLEESLTTTSTKADETIKDASTKKTQADADLAAINNIITQITGLHTTATKVAAQIDTLHQTATTANEKTKQIAAVAEVVEKKVEEYENFLEKSQTEYQETVEKITNLLPGATSAGLASAFNARRKSFKNSMEKWTIIRFISIAGFLIYGLCIFKDFSSVFEKATSNGILDILKLWILYIINKSPILIALVLLEEFARRTYNRLFRLEEDYAFKQVLSESFEGYKKQLEAIAADPNLSKPENLLSVFIKSVLAALSQSPGRIIVDEKERSIKDIMKEALKKESKVK